MVGGSFDAVAVCSVSFDRSGIGPVPSWGDLCKHSRPLAVGGHAARRRVRRARVSTSGSTPGSQRSRKVSPSAFRNSATPSCRRRISPVFSRFRRASAWHVLACSGLSRCAAAPTNSMINSDHVGYSGTEAPAPRNATAAPDFRYPCRAVRPTSFTPRFCFWRTGTLTRWSKPHVRRFCGCHCVTYLIAPADRVQVGNSHLARKTTLGCETEHLLRPFGCITGLRETSCVR